MKNFILVPVLILSTFLFTSVSNAAHFEQSICRYVKADDKTRLRLYLKKNELKLRDIFDNIECEGENLLAFSSTQSSIETGSLIISKLSKRKIQNIITSIVSIELSAIAKKRIGS